MNLTIQGTGPLKMTSREIANLIGKRHPDVKRDIEVMLSQLQEDTSKFAHIYFDSMNRQQNEYHLDREHTECLITGYSASLRMKVIKRIRELESAGQSLPSLPEALRLAADLAEQTIHQQAQIEAASPKVEFADRIAEITKGISIPNFAKTVGLGPLKLFEWMRDNGILIAGGQRHNLPLQRYIDRGYFAVRHSHYEANGERRASFSTSLSGKGEIWLVQKLVEAGMLKGGDANAE
ncbi:DNA-binding protein [Pantoea sp. Acro-805]|uniref:DNA-binding protein n=1 Tax=Candidatus Pantoea formicae TaxID=2608355 RepID=A0ABX0R3L4_9GAMM|nr:phage antirepressor KilAC domain-containing protein [Pantoea formicae]NIF02121.1 DNA-binding protein [Pantoea formicae]